MRAHSQAARSVGDGGEGAVGGDMRVVHCRRVMGAKR